MNSQQIEYILAVAELKSFSKAAQRLYVTQPSLSQYIMKTEQKLGFSVFDRSVNPIALTREGEVFVEYAKQFRTLEKSMKRELSGLSGSAAVRVGATAHIAADFLARPVAELCRSMPEAKISVLECRDEELSEMLINREIDIALSAKAHSGGFEVCELCAERMCLADSSAQKLDIGENDTLDKIPDSVRLVTERVSAEDTAFLLALVSSGAGAAVVPESAARMYTSDNVIFYPLSSGFADKKIKLLTRSEEHSEAVKRLCEMIKAYICES